MGSCGHERNSAKPRCDSFNDCREMAIFIIFYFKQRTSVILDSEKTLKFSTVDGFIVGLSIILPNFVAIV